MQLTSDALPADLSGFLHAPAASSPGPLDISPLLAPNADRLRHWFNERLGNETRWALIVEPHRQIAELISYLLDFELGIQAVSLPGPRLIPNLLRRWSPDLVLAEISSSSGIPSAEDLESLRPLLDMARSQPSALPVILCTTYMEVTPAMAEGAGFAGLIYKPFLPSTLVATVRAALRYAESRG
jgi:DNA-binding NarL/FixJ family response regulator